MEKRPSIKFFYNGLFSFLSFAVVYLSNESGEYSEVYFDDFTVQQQSVPQVKFYSRDHLGSTRVVVTDNGVVDARYDYDALGNIVRQEEGFIPNQYRYTGQEYDEETGLHNYRARFYDSDLGRFYATDPAGQFHNPYSGMGNNPVMMVDPDGEWVHIAIGAAVGGVVNLWSNWDNIDGIGEGFATFGVGALTGGATAACGGCGGAVALAFAGGVLTGGVNSVVAQTNDNVGLGGVDWGQVGLQAGIGGVSGVAGYGASNFAVNNLGGAIVNGFGLNANSAISKGINGLVGGAAGGYVGGFTGGYFMSGGDWEAAHSSGWNGLSTGAIIGFGTGLGMGYYQAKKNGLDPWTGKPSTPQAKGDAGVMQAIRDIQDLGGKVLGERPAGYKLPGGRKGFSDLIVEIEGEIIIVEVKNGNGAALNPNQKINYPKINRGDLPSFNGPNGQVIPEGTTTIKVIVIHYTAVGRIIYSPYTPTK